MPEETYSKMIITNSAKIMQIAMWQCVVGSRAGRGGSNVFYTTASKRTSASARAFAYTYVHSREKKTGEYVSC